MPASPRLSRRSTRVRRGGARAPPLRRWGPRARRGCRPWPGRRAPLGRCGGPLEELLVELLWARRCGHWGFCARSAPSTSVLAGTCGGMSSVERKLVAVVPGPSGPGVAGCSTPGAGLPGALRGTGAGRAGGRRRGSPARGGSRRGGRSPPRVRSRRRRGARHSGAGTGGAARPAAARPTPRGRRRGGGFARGGRGRRPALASCECVPLWAARGEAADRSDLQRWLRRSSPPTSACATACRRAGSSPSCRSWSSCGSSRPRSTSSRRLAAAFLVDDPNLHWTSYGHLSYPEIVRHANEHDYHVAMAMVPIDTGAAHPAAARCSSASARTACRW